jgi:hypothetical protein
VSILNRRNALTGWAVWKVVPRLVKRKLRRKAPEPPPKRVPRKSALAALGAAAAGAVTFLRLRRRGKE